jgi:hypothetical protein
MQELRNLGVSDNDRLGESKRVAGRRDVVGSKCCSLFVMCLLLSYIVGSKYNVTIDRKSVV